MVDHIRSVIIRDDDTSFFTDPERLERVYARLWKKNLPVCLSVIPAHNANVHVAHRPGNPFDPSIAKQYRGQDHSFAITGNPALCHYLETSYSQGLLELCLHGYNHEYMEFGIDDETRIEQKLNDGAIELAKAFPEAIVTTFVAPYDKISPPAFNRIVERGYDISTQPESVPADANLGIAGLYQHLVSANKTHIFTCGEYLFTQHEQPQESLNRALQRLNDESFLVITNHYWTFFYDWDQPTDLFRAWNQFVDHLLKRDDIRITTFQALREEKTALRHN